MDKTAGPVAIEDGDVVEGVLGLLLAGRRFWHAVAEDFGLGLSETVAMSCLCGAPLTARELADRVGLTPSAITTLVDRLERAGLATRTPHSGDRRKHVIHVTDRGREMVSATRGWLSDAVGDLDPASVPETAKALSLLAEALARQTAIVRQGRRTP